MRLFKFGRRVCGCGLGVVDVWLMVFTPRRLDPKPEECVQTGREGGSVEVLEVIVSRAMV